MEAPGPAPGVGAVFREGPPAMYYALGTVHRRLVRGVFIPAVMIVVMAF